MLRHVSVEGHVGKHAAEQARHIGGDRQHHVIQLRLHIGRPLHGADNGGELLARGADGDVGAVPGGDLGHQRLGDGGRHLHLLRAVNDDKGHGVGDVAALGGVHGHQGAGLGRQHVAALVHVFQRGVQLLHAALGVLHPGLQLGQGGVPARHGVLVIQLGLIHLQLGGGADVEQGLGVCHIVGGQGHLLIQNALLVLVALDGGLVADAGRVIAGQGAAQIQGTELLARPDCVAGVLIDGGAFGGRGDENDGLVVGANLAGDLVLRGDGPGGNGFYLDGHTGGAGLLHRLVTAAGGQGQGHRQGQHGGQNSLIIHVRNPPISSKRRVPRPSNRCCKTKTGRWPRRRPFPPPRAARPGRPAGRSGRWCPG